MAKISKQDRVWARTPTDLEYKYSFTKNLDKSVSASTEAQRAARESSAAASNAYASVTNLENEVNALFTKNHEMTGVLTCKTSAYIPPGDVEIATMEAHISNTVPIPSDKITLYDFDNSGVVDSADLTLAKSFKNDLAAFKAWSGAAKTAVTVTLNLGDPEHILKYTGVNLWGRAVEGHVGINFTSVTNPDTEQRLLSLEERLASLEANLGGE